jgi:hypothetical protein
MRTEQLEAWVLSLVDAVAAGHQVEDSRVELKATFPEAKVAARRLAGHANAVESDRVLWVVGLDQTRGVVPATTLELANWWPQVLTEFDGVAPSLQDLVVPTPAGPLVALLFTTSRRPFVVKNPVFGQPGGGSISLEVPWRRGTAVCSARRDEILRLLAPRQLLPFVELLEATADVAVHNPIDPGYGEQPTETQRSRHLAWTFNLTLYVTPQAPDLMVLPTHKASLIFALGSEEPTQAIDFRFFAPYRSVSSTQSVLDSSTVNASMGEAVFRGPGLITVRASHHEQLRDLPTDTGLSTRLSVSPAGSDLATEVQVQWFDHGEQLTNRRSWIAKERDTA